MSNCFATVKLGHWLFALGVSVCLGIALFYQVASQNGNLSSSISGFQLGTGQSYSTPFVTQLHNYGSVRDSTFVSNEEPSNFSSDGGFNFSYKSATDRLFDKESHVDSHVSENHSSNNGYVNRIESGRVVNGTETLTTDGVVVKISKAAYNKSYEKSLLSFSQAAGSVSSRSSSGNIIKNVSKSNNVEGSSHDGLSGKYKFKTVAEPASISDMDLLLRKAGYLSHLLRPRWSSVRDKELLSVKRQLQNVPILHTAPKLDASIYRNISTFRRSYELMESMLKVYVYSEGEKPVFHQPMLDGIYASEGWFIKLMEEDRHFKVQDPREAHLFFLPFSVKRLRALIYGKFHGWKSRMSYIDNFVDLISWKYPFWNRTQGADHFLVACHDWGLRMTAGKTKNCIRSLCNANAADGFRIGKDATLPVTFVRKANEPLRDLGAKLPTKRPTLAFFAGSMHGDLRPVLAKYWQNKKPDMVILGSLPRNGQGQKIYRDHMKNSKYCICARGYEVHTPRIVEAIFQECVPVIIADNYVPPFFEVLNWESFAVFVQEKDVSSLRQILLAISQKKYRLMQQRVKVVQQHFLWHKNPIRYDMFHMILHSVWHNRLYLMR